VYTLAQKKNIIKLHEPTNANSSLLARLVVALAKSKLLAT